ncbi:MAG: hypothetical protein M3Z03_09565 [Actinomycetota bacterium]|nr:hypothetical protein [Actinomycetota bacterium]
MVQHAASDGPRHSELWYDQTGEWDALAVGDRMLISCDGGPAMSRLEVFPPRLEIDVEGGTYVLDDVGPRPTWRYRFVPGH